MRLFEGARLSNLKRKNARLFVVGLGSWFFLVSPLAGAQQPQDQDRDKTEAAGTPTSTATSNKQEKTEKKPATGSGPDSTDARKTPEGYRIGVDDSLYISVWKEPDLSTQVTVRPDGVITLPLINDIAVVGLTPKELQILLTEKLKPFVN